MRLPGSFRNDLHVGGVAPKLPRYTPQCFCMDDVHWRLRQLGRLPNRHQDFPAGLSKRVLLGIRLPRSVAASMYIHPGVAP